jgi:hypothetical protein
MNNLITKFAIAALMFLPAYAFAEDTGGMDMGVYSVYAACGFFVMVAGFFVYLIYCSTHPKIYIPKIITAPANLLQGIAGFEKLIPALNGVYYAAAALMILFAVTFIMQLL